MDPDAGFSRDNISQPVVGSSNQRMGFPERLKAMHWRSPIFLSVTALLFVVAVAGGTYLALARRQTTPSAGSSSGATPIITPTNTPPMEPRPQDIGLPNNADELQKEVEKRSGSKTQFSFTTIAEDFPKDFPVYPGARFVSSIRSTQEGLSFLVVWVTDDDLTQVQTFYEEHLRQNPWEVMNPFTPGIIPALSQLTLTFRRTDASTSMGEITLAKETTGQGQTSIDVSYTSQGN